MLEAPVIQSRGFRNVGDGKKLTGFQVPVRLDYYRGVWVSQLRAATVTVDGETFRDAQVAWTIAGQTVEQSDLAKRSDLNWSSMEPALLVVRKPGGLVPGLHDVSVAFTWSASYMPPRMDLSFGERAGPQRRRLVLVR